MASRLKVTILLYILQWKSFNGITLELITVNVGIKINLMPLTN
jgi:hypothetical protein